MGTLEAIFHAIGLLIFVTCVLALPITIFLYAAMIFWQSTIRGSDEGEQEW